MLGKGEDSLLSVPLHDRGGNVKAVALIDDEDAPLVESWRWSLSSWGYAVRSTNIGRKNITFFMHRVVMGLIHGDERQVDHIDRNKLDNRKANLRFATTAENAKNRKKPPTSQYRGVSWCRMTGRWQAHDYVNSRSVFLGRYDTEESAASAAETAREVRHAVHGQSLERER